MEEEIVSHFKVLITMLNKLFPRLIHVMGYFM